MNTVPGKTQIKNLDVLGIDRGPVIGCSKGGPAELARDPLLCSLEPHTARPGHQPKPRSQYRSGGTKYVTLRQATNIIEAVEYAKSIGLPLVAHLTIHWA